jgi:signal peptidase I
VTTPDQGSPADREPVSATRDTSTSTMEGQTARPAEPKRRRRSSFWRELPFLILIALVLALLIKTFLVQAFYIPSGSMEPTLHGCPGGSGDRVLVNKLVYRFRDPHRGEIIVFRGPQSWQDTPEFTANPPSNPVARFFHDVGSALGVAAPSTKDFIKRVIGVGGDHVVCCDSQGHITVNGHALIEPYIFPGAKPSDQDFNVTVPKGRLWLMGDHRNESADSRSHLDDHDGTIPVNDVIGRAFVKVWPPSHWGTLPVPKTFDQPGLAAAALSSPLTWGFVGAVPLTLTRRRLRARRDRRRQMRRRPPR